MWDRNSPDFAPSPDPAAAAERHYQYVESQQPNERPDFDCETCRDSGYVSEHHPQCDGEKCSTLCPVEVRCPDCAPDPVVIAAAAPWNPNECDDDEEVPF